MKTIVLPQKNGPSNLGSINPSRDKMLIRGISQHIVLDKKEIRYLKSNGNYCEIHFLEKNSMTCSKTLKSIAQRLNHSAFVRAHQSYVINLNFIKSVDAAYNFLTMSNDIEIPISRSSKTKIKALLHKWFD